MLLEPYMHKTSHIHSLSICLYGRQNGFIYVDFTYLDVTTGASESLPAWHRHDASARIPSGRCASFVARNTLVPPH